MHRNIREGHNGNKHAMVPTPQGVLVAAAAAAVAAAPAVVAGTDAAVAAADASAAAAVARGAVKPTAADTARGAAKPSAVDDDDADGIFRRVCRERCHGLRCTVKPRRRAPGRQLAASHLWPEHGCRQHLRRSSSSS